MSARLCEADRGDQHRCDNLATHEVGERFYDDVLLGSMSTCSDHLELTIAFVAQSTGLAHVLRR